LWRDSVLFDVILITLCVAHCGFCVALLTFFWVGKNLKGLLHIFP